MRQGWGAAVAVALAVVVVAVVVTGVAARRSGPGERPAAPTSVGDTGASSSRLPSPDGSYWDPGRMGSAEPAPMPTE
ncbi:hypothetical protein O7628_22930 [Micromonospora sp. WMMD956]|uniref:hypothetical protein n=1 Tax=Micromonospora sp. WMMD956 TaxID=3016108 RepID=UPI002417DF99|nr:hypothetical protein [Micromonospora sp. WMMD956]MDG4818340.1 hypothetical protein [Micromonospora sp. WMMD956]